jgi:hypothetical protein
VLSLAHQRLRAPPTTHSLITSSFLNPTITQHLSSLLQPLLLSSYISFFSSFRHLSRQVQADLIAIYCYPIVSQNFELSLPAAIIQFVKSLNRIWWIFCTCHIVLILGGYENCQFFWILKLNIPHDATDNAKYTSLSALSIQPRLPFRQPNLSQAVI